LVALRSGHLPHLLVRPTAADDPGVPPHRTPSPLPLLDYFGVGLLDEHSDPGEHLAPPITQFLDSRIDQPRGRVSSFSFLPPKAFGVRLLHGLLSLGRHLSVASQHLVPPVNRFTNRS